MTLLGLPWPLRVVWWRRALAMVVLLALDVVRSSTAQAQSDSRLADAANKREVAAIRALIDQKVDPNTPGRDGTPALHWLVRADDLEDARLLIRAGADAARADRYGVTPLSLACSNGNADMIRLLLDSGADPKSLGPTGEPALIAAAGSGNLEAVTLLVDRGAAVDATDSEFQQTPLMVAVRANHPAVVKFLVGRHAGVNARTRTGKTPPWVLPNSVPGFGHGVGIVRGGLPERGSRYLIPGGLSPLMYAARDGRLESAKLLVEAGAEVN
ncbi:MAG TPA: ankyrin repeat domain-containing protein, partial [Vicinamibacterales bacterium]|nr:ankyrin repeat domain-containing protein [Vicinamibacterales bacterium]